MPRSFFALSNLQSLPVELICNVLGYLEMYDLLACTRVTKYLRKVVLDSSMLQYTIELAKHRMVSLLSPSASPVYSARLKLLRDRERAWKYLDWKRRATLRLPPTGSVYEFVGGLYGNGREDDSRITASISFLELPSTDFEPGGSCDELQMWTHSMDDLTIIDFTMDPAQDLLVLVALAPTDSKYVYELHLRSLKTNLRHSNAPNPVLPCLRKQMSHLQPAEVVAAVRVQVAGNLVALLIKEVLDSVGAHLEIWNWENNAEHSCAMSKITEIDDFTFLTQESFLLVRPTGKFEVYSFINPIKVNTVPILRATYYFPKLSEGYMYWYISMSSNPAPGYVPRSPTDENRHDAIPDSNRQIYYPHPDERIHACCLYIFNSSGEENHLVHCFVFFLNIQTLLNPPAEWLALSQISNAMSSAGPHNAVIPDTDSSYSNHSGFSMATSADIDIPIHVSSGPSFSTPPTFNHLSDLNQIPANLPSLTPTYPLFPTFDSYSPNLTTPTTHGSGSTPQGHANASSGPIPSGHLHRPGHPRCNRGAVSVHIPWEVWGPQSTRWFEECLSTDWQHAIYGLRTVEGVSVKPKIQEPLSWFSTNPTPQTDTVNTSGPAYSTPASAGTNGSSATGSSPDAQPPEHWNAPHPQPQDDQGNFDHGDGDLDGAGPRERRLLRIRDFNTYSFKGSSDTLPSEVSRSKGKHKARWRVPKLVTGSSTTPVKGVFTHDIVSSLPYMEVISADSFDVTDVMMDDCRLLLLKRGRSGKLERVDVLMM